MIQIPLRYEEDHVKKLLGHKHYILEAAVERELPDMDFAFLLAQIRGKGRNLAASKMIDLLKTHKPVKVTHFVGLKKWTAVWWAANVAFGSVSKEPVSALLVGWSNIHGTTAIISAQGAPILMEEELVARQAMKITAEYELVAEFRDLDLGDPEELPTLSGLPTVAEIKSAKRIAGLEKLVDSIPTLDPKEGEPFPLAKTSEPEPIPEPTPEPEPTPPKEAKAKAGKPAKKRKTSINADEKKQKLKDSMRKRREKTEW